MKTKQILKLIVATVVLLLSELSVWAAEPDMKMVNAQLKFIKENAQLTQREYNVFSKIFIDYNKKLFEIGQRTPPVMLQSPENWNDNIANSWSYNQKNMQDYEQLNKDYLQQMEKQLSEKSRQKIYDSQMKLWQKMWEEWQKRSAEMMQKWNSQMQQWQGNMQDSVEKWKSFYNDFYKKAPDKQ